MALTNLQLWNYLRDKYPTFKSNTAAGTKDLFTSAGFEQLQQFNGQALNDFFGLSLRVFLQKITVADVKDLLEGQGFGESYSTPYGGYVQRIAVSSIKPVTPAFKGLQDGDSPDPFIVRKPESGEQFYKQNFDYQSMITIPDMGLYKNMFIQENGMSEYMSAIMKALANGYKLQVYNNKLEALNAAINSATYALQDTQQFETADPIADITAVNTGDKSVAYATKYINFVNLVNNIVDGMVYTPATGAFNKAGFETVQDISRLKLLCRPTLANGLKTISKLNDAKEMSLNVDVVKLPDFGGLTPTLTASEKYLAGTVYLVSDDATPTYAEFKAATASTAKATIVADVTGVVRTEINDNFGVKVADAYYLSTGIATTGTGNAAVTYKTIYVPVSQARNVDPNADILAVIADKGLVFENVQNPYNVEPIRNPRGLYTNFWCSSVNNGIVVDNYKNFVVIRKASN